MSRNNSSAYFWADTCQVARIEKHLVLECEAIRQIQGIPKVALKEKPLGAVFLWNLACKTFGKFGQKKRQDFHPARDRHRIIDAFPYTIKIRLLEG